MDKTIKPDFSIGGILARAWHNLRGTKSPICGTALLGAISLIILLFIVSYGLSKTALDFTANSIHPIAIAILQLVNMLIFAAFAAPFIAGILMIGVKRARDEPMKNSAGLQYFNRWPTLAATNIITVFFAVAIEYVSFLIFGLLMHISTLHSLQDHQASISTAATAFVLIITVVAVLGYMVYSAFVSFSLPSVADKQKSPWKAICTSCNLVMPRWMKMTALRIIIAIIFAVSLLPLYFGLWLAKHKWGVALSGAGSLLLLIWTIPYCFLIIGEAYHRLADSK